MTIVWNNGIILRSEVDGPGVAEWLLRVTDELVKLLNIVEVS